MSAGGVMVAHAGPAGLDLIQSDADPVPVEWHPGCAELVDVAAGAGARQLWIHASALDFLGLETDDQRAGFVAPAWGWAPNQPEPGGWRTWWRDATAVLPAALVRVGIPAWNPKGNVSPFAKCCTGPELLAQVERFQELTGGEWHGSGAITSDRWLRDLHRKGTQIRPAELPPPAQHPERGGMPDAWEYPVHWWRTTLLGAERSARYCHHFDKRAMYLGAASSLQLPAGPHRMTAVMQPERPGIWKINRPVWAHGDLPDPFQPERPRAAEIWVTTPTLRYALELADKHLVPGPIKLHHGYVWEESHRYLEPWYRRIRDALAGAERGTACHDAMKSVYQQGWGRLASKRRDERSWDLFQPVWAMTLVAEARNRLIRQLSGLERRPVAVDVDGAYWLTSVPDPAEFAARIGLRTGDGIGQWRHIETIPGTQARKALQLDTFRAVFDALKGEQ